MKLARPASNHAVYVSPSTREGSTVDEAEKELHGDRMRELVSAVPGSRPGIGFWADGAEESARVPVADVNQLPRVAAELGRRFNQKAVVTFQDDPDGPDINHVLAVPDSDPRKIHADMMRHGIEYKTVLPGKRGSVVHVLDPAGGLSPSVAVYAKEAHARHVQRRGKVEFIGGDTREQAAEAYNKVLQPTSVDPVAP